MMKKQTIIVITAIVFLVGGYVLGSFLPVDKITGSSSSLTTEVDSFVYGVGIDMGMMLKENVLEQMNLEEEFSSAKLFDGINAGLENNEDVMSRMQAQQSIQTFITKQRTEMQAESERKAQENIEKGAEFLAQNKTREGVQETESGLQYEVIQEGTGTSPVDGDEVTVHYEGTLLDGTVFDSSLDGDPVTFPVNGVIPGWTEALKMMKPGAKWKLYIPSNLAYGPRQMGEDIEANSTLIFEVELIGINQSE